MSAWRRKAAALFPDLMQEPSNRESLCLLFTELVARTHQAHRTNDLAFLRRAYGFAEWCLLQPQKNLWNPAGVVFFEHILDDPSFEAEIIPWLSPEALATCWDLWSHIGPSRLERIRLALPCPRPRYPENVLHNGELAAL